jgi:hypothetical protein
MFGTQKEFGRKLESLEKRFAEHDEKFRIVFQSIRELMQPKVVHSRRRIGFAASEGQ